MTSLLIRAAAAHLGKTAKKITPVEESFIFEDGILLEALSDKHIKKIKEMGDTLRYATDIHDEVFGKGVQHQEIPYSRDDEQKITSSNYHEVIAGNKWDTNTHFYHVNNHLRQHGYSITDYVGGYAKKEDGTGNEERIGKILSKTGADSLMTPFVSKNKYKMKKNENGDFVHERDKYGRKIVEVEGKNLNVSQAFANDPIRAAKKDVKLVVTRSKTGVAGMSSGKGWHSCMNLDDGCNRHYIPHDISHGTLTAYLIRKGDDDFDSPVGRVNLKQFENQDGHKIWRPESGVYGSMPKSAKTAIEHWSQTRYPHKEDSIYSKNPALYNDDGKSTHITGNPEFGKLLRHYGNHIDDISSNHAERQEEFYDKHGFHEDDDVGSHVHSFLNSLPQSHQNNLIIHSNLTNQDDPSEKYDSDKNSDDHIASWAESKSFNPKVLTDAELKNHIKTAEESSDHDNRYDGVQLSNATDTHASLIGEALSRNDKSLKNDIIHHIIHRHGPNSEWYGNMNDEDSHKIPYLHNHTDNSNILKALYHIGKEGNLHNIVPDVDDMSSEVSHSFGKKIGQHGDNDFLNDFVKHHYNDHVSDEHHAFINGFHSGLNERSDSEEMQHYLIGEMNLTGGHSAHGVLKPITTMDNLKLATNPNLMSYAHEEGHDDGGTNEFYSNVASHTKHQSVHQALKTRTDTQTPEIQLGVKSNKYGLR